MRRGVGVPIAFLVVVAAGCSDGSGAADPLDSTEVSDEAAPSSTEVERSTPATIPPTASTEPETTDPTTTVDPTDQLIADIEADLNAGEQALLTAVAAPADPASEDLVRRYFAGDSLELVLDGLADLRDNEFVGRPNPDVPNIIRVQGLESMNDNGDQATILVCRVDATVIVDLLPIGEAIVNDRVTTVISRSEVVRTAEGIWIVATGERVDRLEGAVECP